MPKLVAFDLDYTLWDFWVDTHVSPPFKRDGSSINQVADRYKTPISFYKDVPWILQHLVDTECHIAACSRTSATEEARQLLGLLLLPPPPSSTGPKRAIEFFDTLEIYPGSKIKHFKTLHKKTGIPYSEMLFFDDEMRNKEVESLGMTMQHVRDGMTRKVFQQGLELWRKRYPAEEVNRVEDEEDDQ
ncbi:magnesium-dependent phosphatase-1 [Ceratobasidium sp. AG-I]|nr:magnesium-dependent phosphatase-1 [Ceratobasidium sp. AG-I]